MSGQASASKECEWFWMSIMSQMSVSIATMVYPDGTTSGPAEYFSEKEAYYLDWIDTVEPDLVDLLRMYIEKAGATLLPYKSVLLSDNPAGSRKYEITALSVHVSNDAKIEFKVNKTLPDKVRDTIGKEMKILLNKT